MGERRKEFNQYWLSFTRHTAIHPHSRLRWPRNLGGTDGYRAALGRVNLTMLAILRVPILKYHLYISTFSVK